MPEKANNPRTVILRDLLLFQMKLWLDGLKDIFLSPLSIAACVVDLFFRRSGQKSFLYGVMRLGERFDLWLNLYGAASGADAHRDGLLRRDAIRGRDIADMIDSDRRNVLETRPHQMRNLPPAVHPNEPRGSSTPPQGHTQPPNRTP